MITAAIVEDQVKDREYLAVLLDLYSQKMNIPIKILEYQDGAQFIEEYPQKLDIIFLDIEMKHLNGMETAKYIRSRDEYVRIVFLTCSPDYAIQVYAVKASNYILKPIEYMLVKEELDKTLKDIKRNKEHSIKISNNEGIFLINLIDICYIETIERKLLIHIQSMSLSTSSNI